MDEAGPVVLCVDDEVVGLRVRKAVLERAGYRVLTAHDGEAGLDLFSRELVDVVILDYSMPGMHGGEVAKRMREWKPDVPIVLLSAYIGIPGDITSVVNDSVTKGEGPEMLLAKLRGLLPKRTPDRPGGKSRRTL